MADYARAASAAAGVLLSGRAGDGGVATDVLRLIGDAPNTRLICYSAMAFRLCVPPQEFARRYAESAVSYAKLDPRTGVYYIFYNDMSLLRRDERAHLAHEFAHTLLGHTRGGGNNDEENEANCCARLLMCPAPVADALRLDGVRQYMDAFDVNAELAGAAVWFRDRDREAFARCAPGLLDRYADRVGITSGKLSRLRRASGGSWLDVWGEYGGEDDEKTC